MKLKNKHSKLKKYINNTYKLTELEIDEYLVWFENKFNQDNIILCRDIFEMENNIFNKGEDRELDEYVKTLKGIENYRDELRIIVSQFFSSHMKSKSETPYDKTGLLFATKTKLKKFKHRDSDWIIP